MTLVGTPLHSYIVSKSNFSKVRIKVRNFEICFGYLVRILGPNQKSENPRKIEVE